MTEETAMGWNRITAFVSGRRTNWLVLALAVLTSGLVLGFARDAPTDDSPTAGLPSSAESTGVADLQRTLPSGQRNPALVVYSRGGAELSAADRAAIDADRTGFARYAVDGAVGPAVPARDGRAVLVAVPLAASADFAAIVTAVDGIRAVAADGRPDGLVAEVTGGAGFAADISKVFEGADVTLLLVTVVVVAVLLLITYRSPLLWLVPLLVVVLGDRVAAKVVNEIARAVGLTVDPSVAGIVSVLVFGSGTNYALLLIARYREELREVDDRHEAMDRALRAAGPAVVASAGTVALSLLTLLAAALTGNRSLGVSGAVGILTALVFATVVLPAALTVFGRGLFWPFVPRRGSRDGARDGVWSRVGAVVARRPVPVIAASLLLLAGLAAGLAGVSIGLTPTQQFRERVEAVDGQETLARYFPAGAADPAVVIVPVSGADRALDIARTTAGVAGADIAERSDRHARIDAVLTAAPGSGASDDAIRALRTRLDAVPDGPALVGGPVAADLDTRAAEERDRRVIIPLVLAVVFVVLTLLLRSIVAPVLLVLTVVASYFASLGASAFAFQRWFDFPALDRGVPLLSFLFLVALGVDYNIFLTTRAREEALRHGTRAGVLTALAVTGGVITSAGVLLAAVFTVLGVLPLITLTQLGVIVGFGVLLDTLLVRSVLVPALAIVADRRFWWPSRLSRPDAGPGTRGPLRYPAADTDHERTETVETTG